MHADIAPAVLTVSAVSSAASADVSISGTAGKQQSLRGIFQFILRVRGHLVFHKSVFCNRLPAGRLAALLGREPVVMGAKLGFAVG